MKSLLKRLSYASFLATLFATTNAFAADITLSKTITGSAQDPVLSDIAVAEGDTLTYTIEVCNTSTFPAVVTVANGIVAVVAGGAVVTPIDPSVNITSTAGGDSLGTPINDAASEFFNDGIWLTPTILPTECATLEYTLDVVQADVATLTAGASTVCLDAPVAPATIGTSVPACTNTAEVTSYNIYNTDTNGDNVFDSTDTPTNVAAPVVGTDVSYNPDGLDNNGDGVVDVSDETNNIADFTVLGIDLTLEKTINGLNDGDSTLSDVAVPEGDVVTYKIEVCNGAGLSDAIGVNITDTVYGLLGVDNTTLTITTITETGGTTNATITDANATALVTAGVPALPTVPPFAADPFPLTIDVIESGECIEIEYTVEVAVGASVLCPDLPPVAPATASIAAATGDCTNTATMAGTPGADQLQVDNTGIGLGTNDLDPDGDPATIDNIRDFTVHPADLEVTKTVSNVGPLVGNTLTYALIVTNTGLSPATNVDVLDTISTLSTALSPITVTSVVAGTSVVTDSLAAPLLGSLQFGSDGMINIDTIAPNQVITITYTGVVLIGAATALPGNVNTVTVALTDNASATDTDTVALDQLDDDLTNNEAEATFMVGAIELTIDKSTPTPMVMQGTNVAYTITVNNTSSTPAINATVTDILPAGLTYVASSLPQVAGVYTIPSIPAMGSYTISIVAQVTAAPSTVITNVATTAAGATQTEVNPADNTDDAIITVIPYVAPTTGYTTGGGSVGTYGGGTMSGSTTTSNTPHYTITASTTNNTTGTTTTSSTTITGTTTPAPQPQPEPEVRPTPAPQPEPKVCEYKELSHNHSVVWNTIPLTGEGVSELLAGKYDAQSVFGDVSINHPYYRSLFNLNKRNIMNGYANNANNMGADANITRAEIAKMVLLAAEKRIKLECLDDMFDDVNSGEWYADYVHNLADMGIVNGYGDGNFGPADNVQYGQMAKILSKTFGLGGDTTADGHWATGYINTLTDKNLVPDGLANEGNYDVLLTRGEVADMLFRVLTMKELGDDTYREFTKISIPKYNIKITASRTDLRSSSVWLEDLTNTGAGFSEGANGNVLFAHSSIWDFDPTPYGPVFKPLVSSTTGLQIGDSFEVDGVSYTVKGRQFVNGDDGETLTQLTKSADYTLFTCDSPDYSNRWVFTADKE